MLKSGRFTRWKSQVRLLQRPPKYPKIRDMTEVCVAGMQRHELRISPAESGSACAAADLVSPAVANAHFPHTGMVGPTGTAASGWFPLMSVAPVPVSPAGLRSAGVHDFPVAVSRTRG